MSKGNTKAQEMTSNISAESILITGESNWIQTKTVIWFVRFVLFIGLFGFSGASNKTNQIDQSNQSAVRPRPSAAGVSFRVVLLRHAVPERGFLAGCRGGDGRHKGGGELLPR
jgi:hypothetical protein